MAKIGTQRCSWSDALRQRIRDRNEVSWRTLVAMSRRIDRRCQTYIPSWTLELQNDNSRKDRLLGRVVHWPIHGKILAQRAKQSQMIPCRTERTRRWTWRTRELKLLLYYFSIPVPWLIDLWKWNGDVRCSSKLLNLKYGRTKMNQKEHAMGMFKIYRRSLVYVALSWWLWVV